MTVRVRLTALYGALFAASGALLMAVSYVLMDDHLHRTLAYPVADAAASELLAQYGLALVGFTLVALALGWAMAGHVLRPLATITAAARRVSDERLDERIALRGGPRDELRELAETFDAMLDRLGDAFESRRRFVANASHELRSPLTVIRTEADVALADPDASAPELRAMGEAVLEATDRTDALLDALLLLARSERGLVRADPVDLAAGARAALRAATPEAQAAGVELRPDLGAAPVVGDPALLERLAGNLVENGARYNRPGGTVDVTTERVGDRAVLRVENTGAPLGASTVARLAEPFERGGRFGGRGAGLGLSIVRTVAEAHGGSLVLSPRSGGGLVATVTLPATAQ